jgi:hypothetical protein
MILVLGVVAASLGCPRGQPRVYPPSINATAAGLKAIEMYDTNKDGMLSGMELDQCPGLKAACTRPRFGSSTLDPAGTGEITAEMIANRIRVWQASRVGRVSGVRCLVTHNGELLEGAEVKFVPEPFLGQNMLTATGVTNRFGMAILSVPGGGLSGVPPGFYRVEITKPARPAKPGEPAKAGLDIPVKYNTQTILGQEVANDIIGGHTGTGITFDLRF